MIHTGGPITVPIDDDPKIDWKPCKPESHIDAVAHDGDTFYIRFKGSMAVYHCSDVAARHLDEMLGHDHPGSYFHEHMKPHYEFKRLEPKEKEER